MALRQAPSPSRPRLLPGSQPISKAQATVSRSKLAGREPHSVLWEPSLPFAGHHRITSIFRLRKRSEVERQSLGKTEKTLVRNAQRSPPQFVPTEPYQKRTKPNLSDYAIPSSSQSYLTLKDDLVKRLNAGDAAIKKSYDITTIARDVLIAANQHPTEKGLNHHLMSLLKAFPEVNFRSDLATFRWDIIEPKPPRPSTSNGTPSTFPHGSDSSIEGRSSLGPQYWSESISPASTKHQSSCLSTPCPVEKPARRTPTHRNRVTKVSSGRTAAKVLKSGPQPQYSPYFDRTPQPQAVTHTSPDRMFPRQSRRRPAIIEKTRKPREVKESVAKLCDPFQCKWAKCQKILSNPQSLQSHVMKEHIVNSLNCGWGVCDCRLPLAAVPLWHHVRDVHLKTLAPDKGE